MFSGVYSTPSLEKNSRNISSPPYAATALTTVFEMLMAVCAA